MTTTERRNLSIGSIDPVTTLATQGTYPADPTHRWLDHGFARAVLTPEGTGTMQLSWTAAGDVDAVAWGDGARWLLFAAGVRVPRRSPKRATPDIRWM